MTDWRVDHRCHHIATHREHGRAGSLYLGCAGDHILDKVAMPRSIDDGDGKLLSLKLQQRDVDSNTTLPFGFQLVQNPSELERALAHLKKNKVRGLTRTRFRYYEINPDLGCSFFKLLKGPGVHAAALIEQMASGCRLATIYVADNNNIYMDAVLRHVEVRVVLKKSPLTKRLIPYKILFPARKGSQMVILL